MGRRFFIIIIFKYFAFRSLPGLPKGFLWGQAFGDKRSQREPGTYQSDEKVFEVIVEHVKGLGRCHMSEEDI